MEAVVGEHARRSRAYPAGRCRILAQPTRQAPPVSDLIYKIAPARLFKQALDYVTAIGGCQIHCLAGKVPPEQRPAAEMTFIRNLMRSADAAQKKNITLLIEPINPRDRPDYFLTRAEQAADIIAKVE